MIASVDQALERFLRAFVPLDERAIDVAFDAPDQKWSGGLTRPAVDLFLWQISGDATRRQAGMLQRSGEDGRLQRKPATPIIQLHYLVTAWASQVSDEHELLGAVLAAVLAHHELPTECLPDQLSGIRCSLTHSSHDARVGGDFWSALGGRLKPGVVIDVSLPFDVFSWTSTATAVESLNVDATRITTNGSESDSPSPSPLVRSRKGDSFVMEVAPEPDRDR
jgi:hypothetical protein